MDSTSNRGHRMHGSKRMTTLPKRSVGEARFLILDADTGHQKLLNSVGDLHRVLAQTFGIAREQRGRTLRGDDSRPQHTITFHGEMWSIETRR